MSWRPAGSTICICPRAGPQLLPEAPHLALCLQVSRAEQGSCSVPLACTRFWAPVLGFFSTVDPWKTPDGEMRPHSTCTPTTLWTFVEPPGSQSSELLTRPMCLRRLVASDPLWTTNHPPSCSLWAGDHCCLRLPTELGCVPFCPHSPCRPPAGGARQLASLEGGKQEFHAQKRLAQSPPVLLPIPSRHSWLLDPSSLVCL